jgi:hypothetical protein
MPTGKPLAPAFTVASYVGPWTFPKMENLYLPERKREKRKEKKKEKEKRESKRICARNVMWYEK